MPVWSGLPVIVVGEPYVSHVSAELKPAERTVSVDEARPDSEALAVSAQFVRVPIVNVPVDEDDGDVRGRIADVVGADQRVRVAETVGRDGVGDRPGGRDVRVDRRRVAGDRAGRGASAGARGRALRADELVAAGRLQARGA